jgi:uncharacterized protein
MKILIARIPVEGSRYEGSDPASILELEADSFARPGGEVEYDLYAQRVSGELVVRGNLRAPMELRCSRCDEFFSTTVEVSDFLRAYSAPEGADIVDITEDMREEVLLHLPPFPLCGEDCEGLPVPQMEKSSGGDREGGADNPWSALDGLDL